MIALGVSFVWNNNDHRDQFDTNGFSNVFIFEKWDLLRETRSRPGVAADCSATWAADIGVRLEPVGDRKHYKLFRDDEHVASSNP